MHSQNKHLCLHTNEFISERINNGEGCGRGDKVDGRGVAEPQIRNLNGQISVILRFQNLHDQVPRARVHLEPLQERSSIDRNLHADVIA